MGELNRRKKTALAQASQEAVAVQTMGGRIHVHWDQTAQATPHGQIVYFAEFLATAEIFDNWVQACPLHYSSPNAVLLKEYFLEATTSLTQGDALAGYNTTGRLKALGDCHGDGADARIARMTAQLFKLPAKARSKSTQSYQLRVELKGVKPAVWRRIAVPGTIKLSDASVVWGCVRPQRV